jgi:GTP-binding protein
MFVDEARIMVAGGRGGDGAVSFHREKFRPKGGPDGGNGGRGGSVVLVAETGVGSLAWLRDHPHQRAASGGRGGGNNKTGADAPDLVLPVPVGTVIKNDNGVVLADLASPGDRFVVARGGRGGRGNAAFLSDQRRAPGFAEKGEPGEEGTIRLDLRTVADVAVIGYPNSGKSTLVAAVSRAHPKIADYPFTTLEPHVGIVERGDERFSICDIPGLVEGAHEGKGLGLKFLRHAERALVFVHLIDLDSGRDPLEDYTRVREELRKFRPDLVERVEVVALNKADAVSEEVVAEAESRMRAEGLDPVVISAKHGSGLEGLLDRLFRLVPQAHAESRQEGFELFRTELPSITVKREGQGWRIHGPAVERWVAMTDLSNPEAVAYLQERLERAGAERALAAAGARYGDEVRIGGATFEWWPSGTDASSEQGPERTKPGRKR